MDRDTRRLLKQAERDKRIMELYSRSPQLKKLDDDLAAAGREGLTKVWQGTAIAGIQKKISLLQEKKSQLLSSLGLDETVYEVAWDCPLCQDRGYVQPGQPCSCQRRDDGSRRILESGLSPLQKKMTFENFSLEWYDQPAEVERLVQQMQGFSELLVQGEPCGNLFLFGPVGNGKTHLCSAVANRVLGVGKRVIYIRTEELLEALREDFYGRSEKPERERQERPAFSRSQLTARLLEADLLILEDLGTERLTDFAEEQLTSLIDQRISWQKPWIITSHLIGDKFSGRYDLRLVDRVLGEGKRLYLKENSIRFKKAQKEKSSSR
ncbi:MAG: ATP-binding protein [Clostridiales bacterium]